LLLLLVLVLLMLGTNLRTHTHRRRCVSDPKAVARQLQLDTGAGHGAIVTAAVGLSYLWRWCERRLSLCFADRESGFSSSSSSSSRGFSCHTHRERVCSAGERPAAEESVVLTAAHPAVVAKVTATSSTVTNGVWQGHIRDVNSTTNSNVCVGPGVAVRAVLALVGAGSAGKNEPSSLTRAFC
jgi:hypothetical protein